MLCAGCGHGWFGWALDSSNACERKSEFRLRYACAVLAGVIFNVSNYLFLRAIVLVGLATAFPVCLGLATAGGTLLTYASCDRGGDPWSLACGVALFLAAVGVASVLYRFKPEPALAEREEKRETSSLSVVDEAKLPAGNFGGLDALKAGAAAALEGHPTPGPPTLPRAEPFDERALEPRDQTERMATLAQNLQKEMDANLEELAGVQNLRC